MKRFFLFVLALSVSVLAAEGDLEERVNGLQAQIDRAMSKAGIHFSGEFRSQFMNSSLDGDAVGAGKKSESVEYTSVDFDIVARPNTVLSARAMFRLHQDWRNFFSDVQNPISTRWLSVDGAMMDNMIKFNIGDYKKKMTPLTLWSPDLEFLYEPEIFAANRRLAMSEVFLGENNRVLQGANIDFKAELYPILHEVSAGMFGARLAARGTGETGVVAPGVAPPDRPNGEYWDAEYDKYLVGFDLGTQVIKGAGLGLSDVIIFDYVPSYGKAGNKDADSIYAKFNAQFTNIFAGRLNADSRIFMDDDFIRVGIDFEAAMSHDKRSYFDSIEVNGVKVRDSLNVLDSSIAGMAVNAALKARVAFGEENVLKLSAAFIHNDTAFRNEAAQSPTFIQRAIMNNENGLAGLGLMNPFDALYRSVFKYAPSQYFGGAKPYTKNAHINSIIPANRNFVNSGIVYPSVFQAALPGGMATADRSGPVVNFDGSLFDKGVTFGVKGAMLKSFKEYDVINADGNPEKFKYEFMEFVGGAGVDIAKFVPVVGPSLAIGGSYGIYNVKYASTSEVKNNLISVGLDYNFSQRFSFLAGYQALATDEPTVTTYKEEPSGDIISVRYKYDFSNLALGFSYKVADGGTLIAKISMLGGKKNSADGKRIETDEITGTTNQVVFTDSKSYTAFQPEVYLTVKF